MRSATSARYDLVEVFWYSRLRVIKAKVSGKFYTVRFGVCHKCMLYSGLCLASVECKYCRMGDIGDADSQI